MDTVPAFASVSEAMDMVQAGLSYLAAAGAAQLAAETQAACLVRWVCPIAPVQPSIG